MSEAAITPVSVAVIAAAEAAKAAAEAATAAAAAAAAVAAVAVGEGPSQGQNGPEGEAVAETPEERSVDARDEGTAGAQAEGVHTRQSSWRRYLRNAWFVPLAVEVTYSRRRQQRREDAEARRAGQPRRWWHPHEWLSGTAWVTLGAVLAVGSTTVSTYYDAKVSNDQLNQSKEDAEDKRRLQARLVNAWAIIEEKEAVVDVHLVNRSPDPVQLAAVSVVVDVHDSRKTKSALEELLASEDVLQPCSERIYKATVQGTDGVGVKLTRATVWDLTFVDREGVYWDKAAWPGGLRERKGQAASLAKKYPADPPVVEKPVGSCAELSG
ncbi:hypothetical protein ACFC00_18780 [Streptomyces adustus]|uniref:hypothetical protein n=1 Tax=Streptomyces adustus TaxID=1609272 RepID=UPI0035DB3B06